MAGSFSGGGGTDTTSWVVSDGPDGATRTSTTYGPLSTPWTATIQVTEGQVVEVEALVAIQTSSAVQMNLALRRGGVTIYENNHGNIDSTGVCHVNTHKWVDTDPGVGDITYEVYVASSAGTMTLRNGAVLDTTRDPTQGKSQLRLTARLA